MTRVTNLGTDQLQRAARARRPGWRDPRLWIGFAVIAASVVAGARILGGADDTVAVWAVARDLGAGDTIAEGDVVARQVDFAEDETRARYLPADEGLPAEDRHLLRGLGVGELLPRAALGSTEESDLQQVPVWAPAEAVPPGLEAGEVVDVWAAGGERRAERLLDDVVVVDVPEVAQTFGPQGNRQVVLGVPRSADGELASTISAAVDGGVVITGQG